MHNDDHDHDHDHEEQDGPDGHFNRIWIHEVNPQAAARVAGAIWDLSEKGPQPITLYIDSPGGDVDAMATIITAMESVPNSIVTVATGRAMSAGAIILAHGNVRMVSPYARVMIHEVSSGAMGNVNDLMADANENVRMNDFWMGKLAARCGKSLSKLKKLFTNERRELYFDAEGAVEFGLADGVGIPHIQPQVQFSVGVFQKTPSGKKKP